MVSVKLSGRWNYRVGNGTWNKWQDNLVVDNGAKLLAGAMGGMPNDLYFALGSGDAGWVGSGIPSPSKSDTSLISEFARRRIDSSAYIEEFVGFHSVPSPNPLDEIRSPILGEIEPIFLLNRLIEIIDGTNKGETRQIIAISGDTVTLDSALSAASDSTTLWRVGVVSLAPSNIIELQTTFPATDSSALGQIREEALYGAGATEELNSGQIYNVIRHPVIVKPDNEEFTRILRLRFNIA